MCTLLSDNGRYKAVTTKEREECADIVRKLAYVTVAEDYDEELKDKKDSLSDYKLKSGKEIKVGTAKF